MKLTRQKMGFFALFSLLCVTLASIHQLHASKDVYIIAPWWGNIFNRDPRWWPRNDSNEPVFALQDALKERGYRLLQAADPRQIKECYKIIWFDMSSKITPFLDIHPAHKQILFAWEPSVVIEDNYNLVYHAYFSKVHTWHDGMLQKMKHSSTPKYRKFFYPRLHQPVECCKPFSERKLITMMYTNCDHLGPKELKSERRKAVRFLEQACPEQFDLYGRWWKKSEWPSYVGSPLNKEEVMGNYKFFLCYENCQDDGYISEKMFDCFRTRCIPVYLGAPNVKQYVPNNCFIDARPFYNEAERHMNYPALLDHLKSLSEEECIGYLQAAESFCSSSEAQCFSVQHFVKIALQALELL